MLCTLNRNYGGSFWDKIRVLQQSVGSMYTYEMSKDEDPGIELGVEQEEIVDVEVVQNRKTRGG